MVNTENNIPQEVVNIVRKMRDLESEYQSLAYARGTDGKRGLYPKMKSVRSQLFKTKENFSHPDWKLVYSSNWPYWHCTSLKPKELGF